MLRYHALQKLTVIAFCLLFTLFNPMKRSLMAADPISDQQARFELAKVLSNLKQYDEAAEEYTKILKTDSEHIGARFELAKIYFYQDREDEALAELFKIPPEKRNDDVQLLIADLYRNQKKYPEAEIIYSVYLQKVADNDAVRLKLAEMLSWQKRYQDSIKEYQIILEHRPEDIQVRRRYAQVLTWMGNKKEAIKEWKKTLE